VGNKSVHATFRLLVPLYNNTVLPPNVSARKEGTIEPILNLCKHARHFTIVTNHSCNSLAYCIKCMRASFPLSYCLRKTSIYANRRRSANNFGSPEI